MAESKLCQPPKFIAKHCLHCAGLDGPSCTCPRAQAERGELPWRSGPTNSTRFMVSDGVLDMIPLATVSN